MKLMVIENDPSYAKQYDELGIDRIFIDLETLGKVDRQGHLDTVISLDHCIEDISNLRPVINKSELLVRVDPINENSETQINEVIERGANIVMLPFFTSVSEVKTFVQLVNNRAKISLLLETPQAACRIDEILEVPGIDEIHIGLNDMHLGMKLDFMFELLSGGMVEYLAKKIKEKKISFGFGGIARLTEGLLPGHMILKEHIRLGSSMVILSRTFMNQLKGNYEDLQKEIQLVRHSYHKYSEEPSSFLDSNRKELIRSVRSIVNNSH